MLKQYAIEMDLPTSLRVEILDYVTECRSVIRQRYFMSILNLLSPRLRGPRPFLRRAASLRAGGRAGSRTRDRARPREGRRPADM